MLTPQGMSEKAQLAASYLDWSMKLYRITRADARNLLQNVRDSGCKQVLIEGEGDIADICRLTCLELGLTENTNFEEPLPKLKVNGRSLTLLWPERSDGSVVENDAKPPLQHDEF